MGACREVSPPFTFFGAQACLIGSDLKDLRGLRDLRDFRGLKDLRDLRDPKDLNVFKPPSGREATMPIADRHIFLTFV